MLDVIADKASGYFREVYDALTDFIYPPICLLCDNEIYEGSGLVCNNCWTSLEPHALRETHLLKYPISAAYSYSENIKKLVHQIKYNGKKSLGRILGDNLGRLIASDIELSTADMIIPVPLHKVKKRERGFNQSLLIAKNASDISGIELQDKALIRQRFTIPQSRLSPEKRRTNVVGAFSVPDRKLVEGKRIILLDDVITTGSTAKECADVLMEAGAVQIFIVAVAISD